MGAHRYTPEQIEFLRDNIAGRSYKEMTELFNEHFELELSCEQVTYTLWRYNLRNGRKNGSAATWFKKGQIHHNQKPVGSETINAEGYIEIKIAEPNKWRKKHIVVWEEANGPVPKGCVIILGDGNRLNTDLDNLILATRSELAIMNNKGLIYNDAELTRTGKLIADMHIKLSQRRKSSRKKRGASDND